jgi:hypothetical protein
MNMKDTIQMDLPAGKVEGVITTRTAGDLVVAITRPYQHLTATAHLPVMARPKRSFVGHHGDERAREMLLELFQLGRFLEMKLPILRRAYAEHLESLRQAEANKAIRDEYLSERRRLKQSLNAGSINQRTYQESMARLRKEHEAAEYDSDAAWLSFLAEWIPDAFSAEPEEIRAVLAGDVALSGT